LTSKTIVTAVEPSARTIEFIGIVLGLQILPKGSFGSKIVLSEQKISNFAGIGRSMS